MVEDPALLARVAEAGVALEVCPTSNVSLGVHPDLSSVPLPELLEAGVAVALGADDPLLFGSRLAAPVRDHAGRPRPRRATLAELGRIVAARGAHARDPALRPAGRGRRLARRAAARRLRPAFGTLGAVSDSDPSERWREINDDAERRARSETPPRSTAGPDGHPRARRGLAGLAVVRSGRARP